MRCIVVDDSKMASKALVQLISQVDFLELKKEFNNPVDAFNYLKNEEVDLVFLDVEMPGMTGLELLKNLKDPPLVILVTSKKEYALDAFDLNVADYITKPISLSRFMTGVYKAKEIFENKGNKLVVNENEKGYIFVRTNSSLLKIKLNDISFVQALGDYVTIHHADKKSTVHSTLKAIEEKLPANRFFRSHRSYLLAIDHIDKIIENTAYIGQTAIPIGEQYKKDLVKKLNLI
jgi:two-component system LytT family response regulator